MSNIMTVRAESLKFQDVPLLMMLEKGILKFPPLHIEETDTGFILLSGMIGFDQLPEWVAFMNQYGFSTQFKKAYLLAWSQGKSFEFIDLVPSEPM